MWTILMVTVEDEGRLMPIGTVNDEGRKILETCYGDGNVIKGDRTFGAIIHPKIQIVAQFTWNNKQNQKRISPQKISSRRLNVLVDSGSAFACIGESPARGTSEIFEGAGIVEEGINPGRYGRAGSRRNR
ncbi:hypothetical protein ACB094_05G214000 [Castanea mollissima]